jgi:hypothetical protein
MGFVICSGWYVQDLKTGPQGGYTVGPCDGEKFDPTAGGAQLPGGLKYPPPSPRPS